MSFPTFNQSLPWTKKTNQTLENELSNIRSVVALNQETNRILENELSNIRSVIALNQENESNSWKWAFQHSISRCPEPRKRIELLKTSFPTFDQLLPWTKKTNRTLENELSNIRSVVALNQENESNSWKWAFQHSISRCPEPSNVGKLNFQEFDSFSWFRARTDRMLENSFSRVRFVFLVQGNDWSNVGKLVFKSSISLLWSGQRLIECWKARFQEFDSFTWFRARTDRMLESSFSRVRFVFLVQGNDWSNVGKLIFKSSIRFLGSGQQLIECWKAHFQEFDSFSWFRATTEENESNSWKWAFQHSISPCPEPSKRIELLKTSFPTFDQSLPWS